MNNRLIKSNDAGGGGGCTNTVDLYNPFPDGGGVALYQLNGDATDVSGNYDASTVNAITWGGAGEFGTSAAFNGSSSYISATGLGITGNSTFTVSTWINTTSSGVFFFFGNGALNASFFIQVTSGGNITVGEFDFNLFTSSQTVNDGAWHNIVFTTDGTTSKLYIDGSQTNILANTFNISADIMEIGRGTSSYYYNGSIDQVRIFNRALRPYEVEALYTEEYCTPTIVPSEHFNTVTYTGNGTNDNSISSGFTPDFVWIKARAVTDSHYAIDSVRTAGCFLYPNLTNAEDCNALHAAIETGGFNAKGNPNASGRDYVAWNFKAGGAAVTNTDGTITSQVSANTEAGFSVVSYTGNGTQPSTIGHGLGSAPKIVMNKCRSLGSTNWHVYSSDLGATSALVLNDTAAAYTGVGEWGSDPSSSVLYVNNTNTNFSGRTYVSYCFAEVEGFSNFGSYVGNGTSKTIVTGFEPAFVMFKVTSEADHWLMFDNKRGVVTDETGTYLIANLSQTEGSILPSNIKFLANGFEITGSGTYWNKANASYIYMAFAADPTTIEPSLEDSFNTVLYTGNGGTQSITGVGFQPDFSWIKNRDYTGGINHVLFDSVRGGQKRLISSSTSAEVDLAPYGDGILSFDSNGFTVADDPNGDNGLNGQVGGTYGSSYVAWCWKGAELPAINSNGSIPSVVSANPAAGFSIVTWTDSFTTGQTVGHGLGQSPKIIMARTLDRVSNLWYVSHPEDNTKSLILSSTAAQNSDLTWVKGDDTFGANWTGTSFRWLAYCFAEVAGFSKFGSYTGTGTSLNQINVGFAPRFVMIKRTNSTGGWRMYDNVRGLDRSIQAQSSDAEYDDTTNYLDFYANGFEFNNGVSYQSNPDINASGGTYIYMAFANQF